MQNTVEQLSGWRIDVGGFEVFVVGLAEAAAEAVEVVVEELLPGVFEGAEDVLADGGSFGAGWADDLPGAGEEAVGIFQRREVGGDIGSGVGGGEHIAEVFHGAELDAGDLALGDAELVGDGFVAELGVEDHFQDAHVAERAGGFESVDDGVEGGGELLLEQVGLLGAGGIPGGRRVFAGGLGAGRVVLVAGEGVLEGAGAEVGATEKIDDFAAEDGEEVGFERVAAVETVEAGEEGDEGVLDEVFGLGAAVEAGAGEGEKAAVVPLDQQRPGLLGAGEELLDEVIVGGGGGVDGCGGSIWGVFRHGGRILSRFGDAVDGCGEGRWRLGGGLG